jgi:hypothetical protein
VRQHHEGDTAAQDLVVEINRPVAEPDAEKPGALLPVLGRTPEGLIVTKDPGEATGEDIAILPEK